MNSIRKRQLTRYIQELKVYRRKVNRRWQLAESQDLPSAIEAEADNYQYLSEEIAHREQELASIKADEASCKNGPVVRRKEDSNNRTNEPTPTN